MLGAGGVRGTEAHFPTRPPPPPSLSAVRGGLGCGCPTAMPAGVGGFSLVDKSGTPTPTRPLLSDPRGGGGLFGALASPGPTPAPWSNFLVAFGIRGRVAKGRQGDPSLNHCAPPGSTTRHRA